MAAVPCAMMLALLWLADGAAAQSGERRVAAPEMVSLPGGGFLMGSPEGVTESDDDERPQHQVTVPAFALSKYAVTRAEFAAFVNETGFLNIGCDGKETHSWSNPGFGQTDRDPVVCVSWDDAQLYIKWLSGETGEQYRLPTEAEWEYAARAGTVTARYWGESADQQCAYANGADQSARRVHPDWSWTIFCDDGYADTAPVGSFKPNGFGLYDMAGNVWQWTGDCWHNNYDGAPSDGSAWTGGECKMRVVRGGSWRNYSGYLRSALRNWLDIGDRGSLIGFRLARTLP